MLLYLDSAYYDMVRRGRLRTSADLEEAIIHGVVKRVRPKMMTAACAFMGLVPILGSLGTGADRRKRIAAPMIGGLGTNSIMELLVNPAVLLIWKRHHEIRRGTVDASRLPVPELKSH